MKKNLLLLSIFFLAGSINAQLPPLPIGSSGVAVNLGPLVSTKAMLPILTVWFTVVEPKMTEQAKAFSQQYVQRAAYYVRTPLDNGGAAKAVLKKTVDRLDSLRAVNLSLGPIYVFRRKDSEARLKTIREKLDIIANDINQLNTTGIYGERINLNQNIAMAVEAYSRKLDTIETYIYNTSLINRLFK